MHTLILITQHALFIVGAVGLALHDYDRPLRLFLWTQPVVIGVILRIVGDLYQDDGNYDRAYFSILYFVGYLVICTIAVKKWKHRRRVHH